MTHLFAPSTSSNHGNKGTGSCEAYLRIHSKGVCLSIERLDLNLDQVSRHVGKGPEDRG